MTAILLKSFSNKISSNIFDEFFKNIYTFSINANTSVNSTSYFITANNTGDNTVKNGDTVMYYTSGGGNVLLGLGNTGLYYITSANSTGFKLANVATGSTVAITASATSETHYIAVQNPNYYMVSSKHSAWTNESSPDTPVDNLNSVYNFQREMIFGKRIDREDLTYMIRKVTWTSGVVYDHYDDHVTDLYNSDFYVLTNDLNVYKCLDNNNGAPSTVKPTGTLTTNFQTADGYVWKYMYTLSSTNNAKFSTSSYIPVDANASISAAAANGAIEFVQVETAGTGYRGFATGYIQQVISNTVFRVETTTTSTSNDFYTSSGFYVSAGTGSGQLTYISRYHVNTQGHFVTTNDQVNNPILDTTSQYIISPRVTFTGDGTGLRAYSNVSTSGNIYSINSINILNRGSGYSYCIANVVANPAYGSGATLRPVLSPEGGHGYNQAAELGSSFLALSVDFANNESTTISTHGKFRKAGIVYNPKYYSNSSLSYANNSFNALYSMTATITTAPDKIYTEGELMIGGTSNAHAIAAWSNTSYVEFSYLHGTFLPSEVVTGQTSGAIGTVIAVATPDINKYTNEVLYYDYFEPIQRSNTTTETVKLLIAI